eukprot:TRINITY_DN455_c1_g1_i5.p1 TRINITY_DN455_c1_g1~~TRINITY_DN455_c1_g1_i5.p1  ORF type:complete len:844 (+),score=312.09 TRINITY_DN455_c1_g1_i5:2277-4808(+)
MSKFEMDLDVKRQEEEHVVESQIRMVEEKLKMPAGFVVSQTGSEEKKEFESEGMSEVSEEKDETVKETKDVEGDDQVEKKENVTLSSASAHDVNEEKDKEKDAGKEEMEREGMTLSLDLSQVKKVEEISEAHTPDSKDDEIVVKHEKHDAEDESTPRDVAEDVSMSDGKSKLPSHSSGEFVVKNVPVDSIMLKRSKIASEIEWFALLEASPLHAKLRDVDQHVYETEVESQKRLKTLDGLVKLQKQQRRRDMARLAEISELIASAKNAMAEERRQDGEEDEDGVLINEAEEVAPITVVEEDTGFPSSTEPVSGSAAFRGYSPARGDLLERTATSPFPFFKPGSRPLSKSGSRPGSRCASSMRSMRPMVHFVDAFDAGISNEGLLEIVDEQELSTLRLISYKFACYVHDVLELHAGFKPIQILVAAKLPTTNYTQNAYRHSYYYEESNNTLFLRASRLDTVREMCVVLMHALSHITGSTKLDSDHDVRFVSRFHAAVQALSQELFLSKCSGHSSSEPPRSLSSAMHEDHDHEQTDMAGFPDMTQKSSAHPIIDRLVLAKPQSSSRATDGLGEYEKVHSNLAAFLDDLEKQYGSTKFEEQGFFDHPPSKDRLKELDSELNEAMSAFHKDGDGEEEGDEDGDQERIEDDEDDEDDGGGSAGGDRGDGSRDIDEDDEDSTFAKGYDESKALRLRISRLRTILDDAHNKELEVVKKLDITKSKLEEFKAKYSAAKEVCSKMEKGSSEQVEKLKELKKREKQISKLMQYEVLLKGRMARIMQQNSAFKEELQKSEERLVFIKNLSYDERQKRNTELLQTMLTRRQDAISFSDSHSSSQAEIRRESEKDK